MKNFILKYGFIVTATTILFTSCQNEGIEVTNPVLAENFQVEEAYPNQKGDWDKANFMGQEVDYQTINGEKIMDGDIIIEPSQIDNGLRTEGTYRTASSSR